MAYAKAITLDTFSYKLSNIEIKAFNALEKGCNKIVDIGRNAFNYISTITNPENRYSYVVLDKNNRVHSNLDEYSLNTRGHLLHLIDRQKEIYSNPDVKEFVSYLKSKGKKLAKVGGHTAANDIGSAIAGISTNNALSVAYPFIGTDYFQKIARQARKIGTTAEVEKLYTAMHETAHTIRSLSNIIYRNIYSTYPYPSEKLVEKTVFEYAMKRAKEATTKEERDKWLDVAEIAEYRYKNVKKIYGKRKKNKSDEKNIEEKVKEKNNKKSESKPSNESEKGLEKSKTFQKYERQEKQYQEKDIEENNGEEVNQDPDDLESKVKDETPEESSEAEACEASE